MGNKLLTPVSEDELPPLLQSLTMKISQKTRAINEKKFRSHLYTFLACISHIRVRVRKRKDITEKKTLRVQS